LVLFFKKELLAYFLWEESKRSLFYKKAPQKILIFLVPNLPHQPHCLPLEQPAVHTAMQP
jgi:hypothetical protein